MKEIMVVNPRAEFPAIQQTPMARRIDSLNNKTVYIVDVRWPYTHQFSEELCNALSEKFPSTTFILKNKTGSYFDDDPNLWTEIQARGNAAIVAVGHCSTCVPAVVGCCTKLEKLGVPAVPIVTEVFVPLVKMYAGLIGMPHVRAVYVPQPISQIPGFKCREYIEGNDVITGRPVIEEIFEGLTKVLSKQEKVKGIKERPPYSRLLGPDTEENFQNLFLEEKMTDFLPILLPTEEKVAWMLKGTSHQPDEVVGELRAGYESGRFTVENVAANAVMAGALPEYMPVILAMAASGSAAIGSSTQSFGRMIVVNGPIRNEIKMNSGIGALSPFNRANAVLGRVATLMSLNLGGGGVPNLTYWGAQGNNLNYNHVTFAENEEALPEGWKPLHVQQGFSPTESVVSHFQGYSLWHWKNTYESKKHEMALRLSNFVMPAGSFKSGFCLLLDPLVAKTFVKEGFNTKESISKYIYDNSKLTLGEFWKYHLHESFSLKAGGKGFEPYAGWLKQPADTIINRYRSPDDISILVVGGKTNEFWQVGDWYHAGSYLVDEWR